MTTRLFITTRTDNVDGYMYQRWAQPLLESANEHAGISLMPLHDPGRIEIDRHLPTTQGLIYFGHGTPEAMGGPPLIDALNIGQASGTIVAVACRTAAVLGRAAVAGGVDSYIGFIDDVPVIDSVAIDALIHDGFAPLVLETEPVAQFEPRFTDACEKVQSKFYGRSRDQNAFLIGQSAQVLKLSLRVLTHAQQR
jgi:hypothetical protein